MSDDLGDRADDYEQRLDDAGGAHAMVESLSAGLRRQERISFWLGVSFIFDLFLTLALLGGYFQVQDNTNDLETNTHNIEALQDRTSDEVLCPLYSVFLKSIDANLPEAADADRDGNVTESERKDYEDAVDVIEAGYAKLECLPLREVAKSE